MAVGQTLLTFQLEKYFGLWCIFALIAKCLPVVGSSQDLISGLSGTGIVGSQSLVAIANLFAIGTRNEFFKNRWFLPCIKRSRFGHVLKHPIDNFL